MRWECFRYPCCSSGTSRLGSFCPWRHRWARTTSSWAKTYLKNYFYVKQCCWSGFGSGSGLKLVSNPDPKHLFWFRIESGTGNKFAFRIESGSGKKFRIRIRYTDVNKIIIILNVPLQAEVAEDVPTRSGHTPDWCLHTDVAAQVLVNRNHDSPDTRLSHKIFIDLNISIAWRGFFHKEHFLFTFFKAVIRYGSGSGSWDPVHWISDPDPAPDRILFFWQWLPR